VIDFSVLSAAFPRQPSVRGKPKRVPLVLTQHPTVYDVHRAKAAFASGCKSTRQSLYTCIDLLKGVPVRLKD
jgi:hypothetical protein